MVKLNLRVVVFVIIFEIVSSKNVLDNEKASSVNNERPLTEQYTQIPPCNAWNDPNPSPSPCLPSGSTYPASGASYPVPGASYPAPGPRYPSLPSYPVGNTSPTYPSSPCPSTCYGPNSPCSATTTLKGECQTINPQSRTTPSEPDRQEMVEVALVSSTKTVPMETSDETSCPIGSRQVGGSCVFDLNCRAGLRLQGTLCVSKDKNCPIGYTRENYGCVSPRVCPRGYVLQNDRCVAPTPVCDGGYKWNGMMCVMTDTQCQPGYILRGNNECEREVSECPMGQMKYGGQCTQNKICNQGYTLQADGSCLKRTERCPNGSWPSFGGCSTSSSECPSNSYRSGGKCFTTRTIPGRPGITEQYCDGGFEFINGMCQRCEPDEVVPTCSTCCPKDASCPPCNQFSGRAYNQLIRNRRGSKNTEVINTMNQKNEDEISQMSIFSNSKCREGEIRSVNQINNVTAYECASGDNVEVDHNGGDKVCCEIMSPRQCEETPQWTCSHKSAKYCGKICISSHIYLSPPSTTYKNEILTVVPSFTAETVTSCIGADCPTLDCSGCIDGLFNCSPECFTYPCAGSKCTFMDQKDFCKTVGGSICE